MSENKNEKNLLPETEYRAWDKELVALRAEDVYKRQTGTMRQHQKVKRHNGRYSWNIGKRKMC